MNSTISRPGHITHYDDCGCRSARYEAEIARLRAALEEIRAYDCECGQIARRALGKEE